MLSFEDLGRLKEDIQSRQKLFLFATKTLMNDFSNGFRDHLSEVDTLEEIDRGSRPLFLQLALKLNQSRAFHPSKQSDDGLLLGPATTSGKLSFSQNKLVKAWKAQNKLSKSYSS